MSKQTKKNVLFGISFDAVPMSGLIVEFIKAAKIFHDRGYEIYFDLGYDIKADKNNFHKKYDESSGWVPDWIKLERMCSSNDLSGYDRDFVNHVLKTIIGSTTNGAKSDSTWQKIGNLTELIKNRILAVWRELEVSFVMVENGTLPENIIYTQALYEAIEQYGKEQELGKFVMWRDHDLMWWSEPGKYGEYPYPGTPRLQRSPHIQFVVLHQLAKEKLCEWSPGANITVLPNSYCFNQLNVNSTNQSFRKDHGLPEEALLIGRCTRIIRQKRIDRDIHLLSKLTQMADEEGLKREIYLFIAGKIDEDPGEYQKLKDLASQLNIADKVIFGNELRSHGHIHLAGHYESKYSISDLLAHCDINSFLTSYNYEGFGNPIGESVASGTPYITTSYELYDSIYGNLGLKGPVLPVSEQEDGLANDQFVSEVFSLLTNQIQKEKIAEDNFRLGQKHLSINQLTQRMEDMFTI